MLYDLFEKLKKLFFTLLKIFLGFLAYVWLLTIIEKFTGDIGVLSFMFLTITGGIAFIAWRLIRKTRCSNCGKVFVLKKVNTRKIDSKSISVPVQTECRNSRGEFTGTHEQYIPGERNTYEIKYKCRICGKYTYKTYTKDRALL